PILNVPPACRSGISKSHMALSDRAASSTVAVSGPTWSWLQDSGITPWVDTRPNVGLRPTMPHSAAGIRTEPAVSVPSANGHTPAATAAADPLLEPPGMCSGLTGLRHGPK